MNSSPEEFSAALRQAVKSKFGRLPSAADLARQLDVATKGQVLVSTEAVRKWLIGKAVPRASAVAGLEQLLGRPLVNDQLRINVKAMKLDELLEIRAEVNARLSHLHAISVLKPESKPRSEG